MDECNECDEYDEYNRIMKCKNIIVTGSGGFIGGRFVRIFKKMYPEIKVIGIDVKKGGDSSNIFYKCSIVDENKINNIFKKYKPDYVFHFAAIPRVSYSVLHPAETTLINIYGTALLLEKSRDVGVKRFIFSSSSSVYGGAKKLPTKENENPPNPRSPYAAHKYLGEILCRQASELYGLDTVSLRYFNVYGPGQYGDAPYSTVASAWLEAMYFPKSDRVAYIEGSGKQSRDFSYVDDVVRANIGVMKHNGRFSGEVFNIGAGARTDLRKVYRLIEKFSGRKLKMERRKPRLGDVRHTQADISKAKRWFRFKPEVSYEKGLQEMVRWFINRKK